MSYVDVSLPRLAFALIFIGMAVAVSVRFGLALGKSMMVGTLRAAIQLVSIGYFLVFLFGRQTWSDVAAVLTVMLVAAAATSARRIEHGPGARTLFTFAFAAVLGGSAAALLPMFVFIVRPHPWFEARYLIPIGGMMMSSAMNVVAQVFERIFSLAHSDAATVEQLLALGASPRQALEPHARVAMKAALIPTINGLLTVGLVSLPGMMTGQILSGAAPEQAVRYQLVIMYQLVAVAAVSGALAAIFARRMLFTRREQLRTRW